MCTMRRGGVPDAAGGAAMSAAAGVTGVQADRRDPGGATWRDPKRYAWPLGLLVPALPFMAWGLVEATGLGVFWWLGPFFVFGVMPVLDTLVGKDAENPPDGVIAWLEEDRFYRW